MANPSASSSFKCCPCPGRRGGCELDAAATIGTKLSREEKE
uniref:Uncharacterized protein n=1 Tax=Arundo donax TaxID=35708 RepID=A0A0A9J8P5_ARUDO